MAPRVIDGCPNLSFVSAWLIWTVIAYVFIKIRSTRILCCIWRSFGYVLKICISLSMSWSQTSIRFSTTSQARLPTNHGHYPCITLFSLSSLHLLSEFLTSSYQQEYWTDTRNFTSSAREMSFLQRRHFGFGLQMLYIIALWDIYSSFYLLGFIWPRSPDFIWFLCDLVLGGPQAVRWFRQWSLVLGDDSVPRCASHCAGQGCADLWVSCCTWTLINVPTDLPQVYGRSTRLLVCSLWGKQPRTLSHLWFSYPWVIHFHHVFSTPLCSRRSCYWLFDRVFWHRSSAVDE